MIEWNVTAISQMANILSGGTPKTEVEEYWNGDIPWLSVRDFAGDAKKVYSSEKTITELGLNNSATQLLNVGDLIISARGTVGEIAQIGKTAAFNQSCYGLRVKEGYSSDYLYYLLKYQVKALKTVANGAVFDTIVVKTFDKMKAPVPPHQIQIKIADALSAYDDLIENNNKRIQLLEQMAENLYQEWFVRFRFPGYENVEFIDGVPSNWRKGKIKEFITFLNGFAFSSDDYNDDGEYGIVTIKNVQDGFFADENVEHIVTIPARMPDYCRLNIGDTLISLTGNVGRVCMVTGDNFLLNQRVAKIQSEYSYYTYNFFRQESIYLSLCNIAYGTAQLNLSPILASNLKVIIPDEEIVKQYNELVKPIYDFIQKVNVENRNLKKQCDLLLPRLMSGKLEV